MESNNRIITLRGNIVTENKIEKGYLRITGGIIEDLGDIKPGKEVFDFGDCYIVPGFIDLHTHGIHHFRVDHDTESLKGMCRVLPRYGVTGFLPTVTSRPKGEDSAFLSELAAVQQEGSGILGYHLEGPFLKLTGALSANAISGSDRLRVESLIKAAKPYKAIFSVSPDVEGIEELLPLMAVNDTPVFMTHTGATVKQAQKVIELGVRHATHFYNVFPCPPEQDPGVRPCGVVEAVLADPRVSVDFILDGVHVDPVAVRMALRSKSQGPGRVCLVTDSNLGAGLEPGRFVSMGREIEFTYKGGPARQIKDNTLCGSGLTMDQALRNAIRWLDIDLPEAVKMVSTNPAEVINLGDRLGKLHAGYNADFVILDKELNVIQTWISGKCYYKT